MSERSRGEDPVSRYNARLGLWLFLIYVVIYGGFVTLCAFSPDTMKRPVLSGVNLAIVYGMVLIFLAFLLALIYMAMTRSHPPETDKLS